ncbi:TetR/AcrR family transcriptional regulator [Burkholderia sp. 22PA0099]|uniref:TetR/AcrR family transcriptional regulator n=1 Tax=Burkholderia sp. 22PA0099 TaxID=3237372 RepID=UPI0039C1B765
MKAVKDVDSAAHEAAAENNKRARGRPVARASVGREAILRAARGTFARRGFDATSVREISRECGVDAALIAHHFGAKEALWLAVVEHIAEHTEAFVAALRALDGTPLTARQRLEQAIALLVREVFAEPDLGMFFSTAATAQGDRLDVLIDKLVRPCRDALVPLLADAARAGDIAVADADLSFFMLVNAISTTVSYEHLLTAFTPLPKQRERYQQAVLATAMNLLGA